MNVKVEYNRLYMHVMSQSVCSCYTNVVIYKKRGKDVSRLSAVATYIPRMIYVVYYTLRGGSCLVQAIKS